MDHAEQVHFYRILPFFPIDIFDPALGSPYPGVIYNPGEVYQAAGRFFDQFVSCVFCVTFVGAFVADEKIAAELVGVIGVPE